MIFILNLNHLVFRVTDDQLDRTHANMVQALQTANNENLA